LLLLIYCCCCLRCWLSHGWVTFTLVVYVCCIYVVVRWICTLHTFTVVVARPRYVVAFGCDLPGLPRYVWLPVVPGCALLRVTLLPVTRFVVASCPRYVPRYPFDLRLHVCWFVYGFTRLPFGCTPHTLVTFCYPMRFAPHTVVTPRLDTRHTVYGLPLAAPRFTRIAVGYGYARFVVCVGRGLRLVSSHVYQFGLVASYRIYGYLRLRLVTFPFVHPARPVPVTRTVGCGSQLRFGWFDVRLFYVYHTRCAHGLRCWLVTVGLRSVGLVVVGWLDIWLVIYLHLRLFAFTFGYLVVVLFIVTICYIYLRYIYLHCVYTVYRLLHVGLHCLVSSCYTVLVVRAFCLPPRFTYTQFTHIYYPGYTRLRSLLHFHVITHTHVYGSRLRLPFVARFGPHAFPFYICVYTFTHGCPVAHTVTHVFWFTRLILDTYGLVTVLVGSRFICQRLLIYVTVVRYVCDLFLLLDLLPHVCIHGCTVDIERCCC